MRVYATLNDRTARRSFAEPKHRHRPLTELASVKRMKRVRHPKAPSLDVLMGCG